MDAEVHLAYAEWRPREGHAQGFQRPYREMEPCLLPYLHAITAGQVLGKRPGAIRTAAHRGLKTLHKELESGGGRLESGGGAEEREGVLKNGRTKLEDEGDGDVERRGTRTHR